MKRLLILIGAGVLVFTLAMLVQDALKEIRPTDYQMESFREMRSFSSKAAEIRSSIGLTNQQYLALEKLRVCAFVPVFLIVSFFVLRNKWSEQ